MEFWHERRRQVDLLDCEVAQLHPSRDRLQLFPGVLRLARCFPHGLVGLAVRLLLLPEILQSLHRGDLVSFPFRLSHLFDVLPHSRGQVAIEWCAAHLRWHL